MGELVDAGLLLVALSCAHPSLMRAAGYLTHISSLQ